MACLLACLPTASLGWLLACLVGWLVGWLDYNVNLKNGRTPPPAQYGTTNIRSDSSISLVASRVPDGHSDEGNNSSK